MNVSPIDSAANAKPTIAEICLRVFLVISAVGYLVGGFAFVLFPDQIIYGINHLSELFTQLKPMPAPVEKFWLCLAFSMMMTIATLCYVAQSNIRERKNYACVVLVAKFASAISAIGFFLFSAQYFAYLVIFVVDGGLFLITAVLLWKAHLSFNAFKKTLCLEYCFGERNRTLPGDPVKVVIATGEKPKELLLKEVLDHTKFDKILENKFQESGKTKEKFSVVIKPNFMFMHSKRDPSTYTDPELVEALISRIIGAGFTNVAVVESQSSYGNFYDNRDVLTVADYIGYSGKNYRIVDLTSEMVEHEYPGRLGWHFVGPTWRDADFRISFAKNKTHTFCHYTLTLKNIYGVLPMQNKVKEYHYDREYDWPTMEILTEFEVHYGLIDAFISADGNFGVIVCPEPKHTKTIIGGENLLAVDWVGAKKMGLNPDDPMVGRYLPMAVKAFKGMPKIDPIVGDQSVYRDWRNANDILSMFLDLIEECYGFAFFWFTVLSSMDAKFPLKEDRSEFERFLRKILAPLKRTYFLHDELEGLEKAPRANP